MTDPSESIPLGDAVSIRILGEDSRGGLLIASENGQEIYLSPNALITLIEFLETGLILSND